MTFLFDENIGEWVALGMAGFGESAIFVAPSLPLGSEDEVILPYVGRQELILVTFDRRMRRVPLQRHLWREHKVGGFILTGAAAAERCARVRQLIAHWPEMKALAKSTARPFAFEVHLRGGLRRYNI